jgi:hypothetical protein
MTFKGEALGRTLEGGEALQNCPGWNHGRILGEKATAVTSRFVPPLVVPIFVLDGRGIRDLSSPPMKFE